MKRKRPAAIAVLAGLFAIGAIWAALGSGTSTPAHATTTTVNIGDNWFSNSTTNNCGSPCVTNIGVGDTVHWVWIGPVHSHSTTSDASSAEVWDSGIGTGFTFDHTFNTAGSFSYHCNVHGSMHGQIVVGPTPPPPNTNTPTNTRTPTSTFTVGPSPTPTATRTPAATTEGPTATATETETGASPTVTPPGPTISATYTPTFTITLTPVTTPTPAGLVGDANKDGHVDSIDAAIVLQYAAGLVPYINPRADANQNGEINAIDATLILQYVAGLVSRLPP